MSVVGLLLAAGSGSRYGRPKALVDDWLSNAAKALRQGGCDPVIVVLGAGAAEAARRLPTEAKVVVAKDWSEGMSASLRAGLTAALDTVAAAALVHLVDLPDVGAAVVRRVRSEAEPQALARATYRGIPGHPVLLGRAHWRDVIAGSAGDEGARSYLRSRSVVAVECADLARGADVDLSDGRKRP